MNELFKVKRFYIIAVSILLFAAGCAGPQQQRMVSEKRQKALEQQRMLEVKISVLEQEIAEDKDISKVHELATLYLRKKDPGKCLELLSEVRPGKGETAQTHHLRATAYKFKGDAGQAEISWEKALELDSKYAKACYNLGVLCYETGQLKKAKKHWNRTLKIDPTYHKAAYNLGVLYHGEGDLKTAKKHYEQTLEYQPEHIKANINLGLTYCKLEDLNSGLNYFQKATELDPENYFAFYNLGLGKAMQGKLDEAVQNWEKARKMQTRDPWLYYNLAIAYDSLGKTKKALTFLEEALEIDPEFEQAKQEYRSLLRGLKGS